MYRVKKKNKEGRRWYLKLVVVPAKIFKKASVINSRVFKIGDIARFISYRDKIEGCLESR